MTDVSRASRTPGRASRDHGRLVAAYRDGLGLAAFVVLRDSAAGAISVAVDDEQLDSTAADPIAARWWCRRADAERIAAAATARLRRLESRDRGADAAAPDSGRSLAAASVEWASAAIAAIAERLNVALHSDDDVVAHAANAIARVEAEIAKLQQTGGMKSVNRAYKSYRLETSARGERILRYDEWMQRYRENLIRQVASTLRSV